jgi:hypothetical protein
VAATSSTAFTVTPSSTDKPQGTTLTINVSDGTHTQALPVTFSGDGICLP